MGKEKKRNVKIKVCNMENIQRSYHIVFNPLKTKRRPLYLKTQFLPRCKHFSSRL